MEKNQLVSIILPVYNGERYLAQSIESCLHQTHTNIELVIVNDSSTDSTLEIAESYQKKDKRIRIINNVCNKKLPASLNIGHEVAKGDFCTWTSDDNYYKEDAIEKLLDGLIKNKVDIVYSDFYVIDENDNHINTSSKRKPSYLPFYNVIGACFLYTKKSYMKVNGYEEEMFLVEDYNFWKKLYVQL